LILPIGIREHVKLIFCSDTNSNNRKLKQSDEIDREKRLHAARVVGETEERRRDNANRMKGIDGEKEGRAR